MNKISHSSLTQLLNNNVVELVFSKRGDGSSRRMLCTNSKKLLNSIAGKIALKFKPPKGVGLPYDPKSKNLVVTWDLFWQDFRQIPLESVNIVSAIPLRNKQDIDNFWVFFDRKLQEMSPVEKRSFMDL